MTDCSLNYEFSARKIRIQNILCKKVVFLFLFWNSKQFLYTISHILNLYFSFTELVIQWTMWCIFCGLADARMSASEKNLPVIGRVKMLRNSRWDDRILGSNCIAGLGCLLIGCCMGCWLPVLPVPDAPGGADAAVCTALCPDWLEEDDELLWWPWLPWWGWGWPPPGAS